MHLNLMFLLSFRYFQYLLYEETTSLRNYVLFIDFKNDSRIRYKISTKIMKAQKMLLKHICSV